MFPSLIVSVSIQLYKDPYPLTSFLKNSYRGRIQWNAAGRAAAKIDFAECGLTPFDRTGPGRASLLASGYSNKWNDGERHGKNIASLVTNLKNPK